MSRFRPARLLSGLFALGLTLTLSAAGVAPTSAAGAGKPASPAAAQAAPVTRALPAGATACPSTKAKPSSQFAACAGPAPAAASLVVTVTLTASSTSVPAGGTTTLTATASLDVGPTPFFIEIFNKASGVLVAECGAGTVCAINLTTASTVQSYLAVISSFGSTLPPPNIQATSGTVMVSWISLTIASSPVSVAVGHQATVTATASLDVAPTPFWTEVFDLTTNTEVALCPAGTDCVALVNQSVAGPHAYVGYVADQASALPPPDIRAGSSTAFVDWVS